MAAISQTQQMKGGAQPSLFRCHYPFLIKTVPHLLLDYQRELLIRWLVHRGLIRIRDTLFHSRVFLPPDHGLSTYHTLV